MPPSLLRLSLALSLLLALAGCAGDYASQMPPEGAEILALGDSVVEWNAEEEASIPDMVGEQLGRVVFNAAVSGARFTHPDPQAAEDGLDIRAQYARHGDGGDWDWVVLDGGANDLGDECGCSDRCETTTLPELIAQDGRSGAIPAFVEEVRQGGARVAYVGYYDAPEGEPTAFTGCAAAFDALDARLRRMARAVDGVVFVSARDVIDPADAGAYDDDRVHPSVRGSRLIGEHVARAIEEAE
jgi:lysophospholipase L1-like esterase